MINYYLDSSSLVKRYALEQGSRWIKQLTDLSTNIIVTSELTMAEVAAALAARGRSPGGISSARLDRLLGRFFQDCNQRFLMIPVERLMIDQAVKLTRLYRLRGYDAVQLAMALVVKQQIPVDTDLQLVFVTDDKALVYSAQVENLLTETPSSH